MPPGKRVKGISRREFIKSAGVTAIAAGLGASIIIPGQARGAGKKLKILQYDHNFGGIGSFDEWFKNTYVEEWGKKNDIEVTVTNVLRTHAACIEEVSAQKGHDLVALWPNPAGAFENHVIDHREIWSECERKYGNPIDMAVKNSYNPKTKKYFAFCPAYSPLLANYRKDLWDDVGVFPDSWEDVLDGGRKIKKKHDRTVGISLGNDADGNFTLRAILYACGASVQDEMGNLALNSKQTLDTVKFVKALYEEAMNPGVAYWNDSSNNYFMLRGSGSFTVNVISIARRAERDDLESSRNIQLAKIPKGMVNRIGPSSNANYLIWRFAENIEGAKKFLIDYVGNFQEVFLESKFVYLPCFPSTVPNLNELLANDPQGHPSTKYKVLIDAHRWMTNLGYPGYASAAIDEIFGTGVISEMFARAATGEAKPEEAIREAEAKCKQIFALWKEKGIV